MELASFVCRGKGVALAARRPGRRWRRFDGTDGHDPDRRDRQDARRTFARAAGCSTSGKHYLQFAGSGEYFLKVGADSPETLLAYADFDGTVARKPQVPLHTYAPHVQDWKRRRSDVEGRQGQGTDRRRQLPGVQGRELDVVPAVQRRRRRRQRLAVRRARRQVPLRRVEARPVADRLRSRAAEGHLPAFQAAGERERRQRSRGPAKTGVRPIGPVESLDGGELGPSASSISASSSRDSATRSRSTGTSAKRTRSRPSSSWRWR